MNLETPFISLLFASFGLGLLHGITPDEHTWPITFSYSVGSYSTRGGYRSGLSFSLAFTLQRAIASEIAFLGLAFFLASPLATPIVYIVVGLAMSIVGFILLTRADYLHVHVIDSFLHRLVRGRRGPDEFDQAESHPKEPSPPPRGMVGWLSHLFGRPTAPTPGSISVSHLDHSHPEPRHREMHDFRPVDPRVAAIHGFIAGWGFGAFALLIYFVIAPQMPNAYVGWVPGALFGLGTTVVQVVMGTLFGWWVSRHRGAGPGAIERFGRRVSGNVLFYGGLVFAVAGALIIVFPSLASFGIPTGIPVYNLDSINVGLFLVILSVGVVGGISIWQALRELRANPRPDWPGGPAGPANGRDPPPATE